MRYPKLQIFVEMFCTNLQSPVWIRHIGAPQMCPNWTNRQTDIGQTDIYINTFPATLTSQMAKSHKINAYFLTNTIVTVCHGSARFPANPILDFRNQKSGQSVKLFWILVSRKQQTAYSCRKIQAVDTENK